MSLVRQKAILNQLNLDLMTYFSETFPLIIYPKYLNFAVLEIYQCLVLNVCCLISFFSADSIESNSIAKSSVNARQSISVLFSL